MSARLSLFCATLASLVWGFRAMLFTHAPDAFRSPLEDMSFAWFVPVFSAYVLWDTRESLRAHADRPSVRGLVACVPFLLLGFLGARGLQLRFEILAFAGLLVTLVWTFWGARCARDVLFPAAFLLFCMPLATFLDAVTVHLRLLACSVAYHVMHGFGVDVVRQGTALAATDGAFSIDVAEPCSGLRSIFALLALAAGYAYYLRTSTVRKFVLFFSAVPLAILGNVVRILSICCVARLASADFANGFYHDYSGYVVFLVAILLMLCLAEGLALNGHGTRQEEPADGTRSVPAAASPILPVLAVAIVVPFMAYQGFSPQVTLADAPPVALGDLDGFSAEDIPPAEAERALLPSDTRIEKRLYSSVLRGQFLVTLVVGGASKSSIHRPELCLPAQGFLMESPETEATGGSEWRVMGLSRGVQKGFFAYTFFNQEGYRTCSHVRRIFRDVWDRSVLARADRWVMVTVHTPVSDRSALLSFLNSLKGVLECTRH